MRAARRVLVVALVAATLAATATSAAGAKAGSDDPAARRREVRARRAKVAARLDVLKASDAEVHRALDALEADVRTQQAVVEEARRAVAQAERAVADAKAAEVAKAAELDALRDRLRRMAIEAYVNPTAVHELAATLSSSSLTEATRRRELLAYRVKRDGDLAARVAVARDDLALERATAEAAQRAADERRAAVESELGAYRRSLAQQQRFVEAVETRLDAALAEADALARLDTQLSREIARRNEALARRSRSPGGAGRSGRSGTRGGHVETTSVRGIVVATSIADELEGLLAAAEADGFVLGGGGYRDSSDQVALRRAHCGTSDYAVYDMPPSQCRPPTARPGASLHEQGLAVDFTWQGRIVAGRSSPAFQWLAGNAGRYGFRNLPSEPWHWSTNGD